MTDSTPTPNNAAPVDQKSSAQKTEQTNPASSKNAQAPQTNNENENTKTEQNQATKSA